MADATSDGGLWRPPACARMVDLDAVGWHQARGELDEICHLPDTPSKAARLSGWKRRYLKPEAWGPTLWSPGTVRDGAFWEVLEKAMKTEQYLATLQWCAAKGLSPEEAFAISPPDHSNFYSFQAVCGGDPEHFFLERGHARSDAAYSTLADWFYEVAAETAFNLSKTLAVYGTPGECKPGSDRDMRRARRQDAPPEETR